MTDTARRRRRTTGIPVAVAAVALLAMASCGDDDDATGSTSPSTPASTTAPVESSPSKPPTTTSPTTTIVTTTSIVTTTTLPATTAPPPPPVTTVAPVVSTVPAVPSAQPVLADGWCSPALVAFMVDQSTSFEFQPGFAVPDVDAGLPVGCSGTSPEVSFAGYIDTFSIIRNDPGVIDVLADRIRAAGYVDDPLADPAHPMFMTPSGDPTAFVTPLDMKSANGASDTVFQDAEQWIVVQFYLPGG